MHCCRYFSEFQWFVNLHKKRRRGKFVGKDIDEFDMVRKGGDQKCIRIEQLDARMNHDTRMINYVCGSQDIFIRHK